jgi:TonB family protein
MRNWLVWVMMFAPANLCGQWLHQQVPTISGGLFSNAGGLVAADQFVLEEPAAITALRWYGFFQNASIVLSDVLSDEEPAEVRFRISFFEDGAGVPARLISQQEVAARVRSTGVQIRPMVRSGSPTVYEFTAASLRPVALDSAGTIWISISAVDAPALWLWSRSVASDTDTLAVEDDALDQDERLDWQSNGRFGQLAFTLTTGSIDDLPISRPAPPVRPGLTVEGSSRPLTNSSTERPVSVSARSEPQYTDLARRARVSGIVALAALVEEDGSLTVMGIVEGLGFGLDEMAQSALQEWRFGPAMRDGRPVDTRLYLEVRFSLR